MIPFQLINTPQTKRENIVDETNGISVADPYRWLEDGDSKEVGDWISVQNQYTDSILRNDNKIKRKQLGGKFNGNEFLLARTSKFSIRIFAKKVRIKLTDFTTTA